MNRNGASGKVGDGNEHEAMLPRGRLMRARSPEEVSDEDLLAVLLGTGTRGCEVTELARRLASALRQVLDSPRSPCDWRTLEAEIVKYNGANRDRPVSGIGHAKLLKLAAAFELANRRYRHYSDELLGQTILRSSQAAYQLFENVVARHPEQEQFYAVPIDAGSHSLCRPILVAKGGVGSVAVHPREVFCEAVRWRAHAVIVAHNHPNGDPTPSERDLELTRALLAVSKLMRIPLLDHLVIAGDTFVSIRTQGEVSFA